MQVGKTSVSEKMPNQGIRFFIPPFQRAYSWEQQNWEELFEDLKIVSKKNNHHFIGSVVIQKTNSQDRIIIDGQQRLTTISLLLLSLAKWIKKNDSGNTFLYDGFIKNFLITTRIDASEATKIELSKKNDNHNEFENLVFSFYKPNYMLVEIKNRYLYKVVDFFEKEFDDLYENQTWDSVGSFSNAMFNNITLKLTFIEIELEEHEDANVIFETLNSRGKPLDSSDLIRNYIFMLPEVKKAGDLQIYENHWHPIEKYFENLPTQKRVKHSFSDFLRHFLFANIDSSNSIVRDRIYPEMKAFLTNFLQKNTLNALFDKLKKYKEFFNNIIFSENIDKIYGQKIKIALNTIKYTDVLVSTPFILKAFDLFSDQRINKETLEQIMILLASYTLRLVIHERKFPNKIVPVMINILESFEINDDPKKLLKDIENKINLKTSPFYSDDSLKSKFLEYDIYSNKRKELVRYLIWIAVFQHSEGKLAYDSFQNLSIEHIFAQNASKQKLQEADLAELKKLTHTIGNLTLVKQALNAGLSNKPFSEKRAELKKYTIWEHEGEKYFSQEDWTKELYTIIFFDKKIKSLNLYFQDKKGFLL